MFKFSPKQRFLMPLLVVPVAIFFAARSAASWRPQFITKQNYVANSAWSRGTHFLHLSPDEKWLISEGDDGISSSVWDLTGGRAKHSVPGTGAVFSSDSRLVATFHNPNQVIFLDDCSRVLWSKRSSEPMEVEQISFASNNSKLQYRTNDPKGVATNLGNLLVTGDLLVTLDALTGKELSRKKLGATIWQTESLDNDSETINPDAGEKISLINPTADKLIFSLKTSNGSDRWEVAPDGKHLWVSQAKSNRFDIHDAKTGRKLWAYPASLGIGGNFMCYPSWENGGTLLATIEDDTLIVRDSQSGKVLLSRKNPLSAALKSWTFTHDRSSVYLMDANGKIFRQRVR